MILLLLFLRKLIFLLIQLVFVLNLIVGFSFFFFSSFYLLSFCFLDVFVVVRPVKFDDKTHYAVEWCAKPGVPPFKPYETNPPLYESGEDFKERFLTKCLSFFSFFFFVYSISYDVFF